MALLETASSTCRIVDQALRVSYTRRLIFGSWTHTTLVASAASTTYNSAWEYVRRAEKSYRYIGLSLDAANTKAAALETLYTRSTKISDWQPNNGVFSEIEAGDIPMADICVQLDGDGASYSVVVHVHEEDTRLRLTGGATPSSLFTAENNRTYDTD